MKIRIKKDVLVEVEKTKLQEVWDKQLRRWDELNAEVVEDFGLGYTNIITFDGDVYRVPSDSFEVLSS